MRHIPEEELHAYLDQALSRSQCVEIECHLAACAGCAAARDRVAAIRDRTTALLAATAPRAAAPPPPFEQLLATHLARRSSRRERRLRWARTGAIAAALLGAVGAGWWTRGLLSVTREPEAVAAAARTAPQPAVAAAGASTSGSAPAEGMTTPQVAPEQQAGPRPERTLVAHGDVQAVEDAAPEEALGGAPARAAPMIAVETPNRPEAVTRVVAGPAPLAVEVTSLDALDETPGFVMSGLWQSVDWQTAWAITGGNLPRIGGLPVLDVQIQRSAGDARPLVVVSQQHPSGRVIRTIEGPVERVAALVEGEAGRRFNASAASFTPPDYIAEQDGTTRRGLRILTVTGAIPADSLNALAQHIGLRE